MHLNLIEMWQQMPWPVRAIVIVLSAQAIGSFAVVIDRLFNLRVSSKKSKAFAASLERALDEEDYDTAMNLTSEANGSHLAMFIHAGLTTFIKQVRKDVSVSKSAELSRRALERQGERVSASLNQGMNILASTGSTAPFVGLLGTVLGILNAFRQISESGSGGIAAIGGAIGEALIVTGYGLVVAIPTVLLFNWLSNKIAIFEGAMVNAGGELVDRLEADFEAGASNARPKSVQTNGVKTEKEEAKVKAAPVKGLQIHGLAQS